MWKYTEAVNASSEWNVTIVLLTAVYDRIIFEIMIISEDSIRVRVNYYA